MYGLLQIQGTSLEPLLKAFCTIHVPEGPSTKYLRTLVPKACLCMVFGTRDLKCWVLGPSGQERQAACNALGQLPKAPSTIIAIVHAWSPKSGYINPFKSQMYPAGLFGAFGRLPTKLSGIQSFRLSIRPNTLCILLCIFSVKYEPGTHATSMPKGFTWLPYHDFGPYPAYKDPKVGLPICGNF